MAQLGRRYLVHIRIGSAKTPTSSRIAEAAEGVKKVLEFLAPGKGNCQLAYTSHDGATFGFLLKTTRFAGAIRAQLESPGKSHDLLDRTPQPMIRPPLTGDDSILVVELGEDMSTLGFTRAGTWLQHH